MYSPNSLTGQYRELGVLLWRGWGIDAAMAQCFGNERDMSSKGRQMPVVYVFTSNHFFSLP
jgi:2-oxoisovalerate dehydrogenase E1 component subunit alpha